MKYWIDKQRNTPPVIAYGVAGNYQTLTLQQTLRHLNKKDKQIAVLEQENKALREAAQAVVQGRHQPKSILSMDIAIDELIALLREVEDE